MRILYLTLARSNPNELPLGQVSDYMSDLLFHGLRSLYEENVVDYPRKDHMYKNYAKDTSQLWGRGFTYSKILDNIDIDRGNDLGSKIINNFFDLIVLTVHHTIHSSRPELLYHTLESFKSHGVKSKIAVVDGHDTTTGYDFALEYTPFVFKREIADDDSKFIPIHFALPSEKVVKEFPHKDRLFANIVPSDHSGPMRKTHHYTTEKDYYEDYQKSLFGINVKKGGFQCERVYETMGNACIPLFGDLESCPKNTHIDLPKKFLLKVKRHPIFKFADTYFTKNQIQDNFLPICPEYVDDPLLLEYCNYCWEYTKNNLTTEHLAKYFLEKIK